jgi:phospholipase C
MRSSSKLLLALLFFGTALAPAQTIPAGTFKHIIIIVQENRTPDNLFGSAPSSGLCGSEDPFRTRRRYRERRLRLRPSVRRRHSTAAYL